MIQNRQPTKYSEAELIDFGNYILECRMKLEDDDRYNGVQDAWLENWCREKLIQLRRNQKITDILNEDN